MASSVKFRLAAWAMRSAPHTKIYKWGGSIAEIRRTRVMERTLNARYLLSGNFCISKFVGSAHATHPTTELLACSMRQ
jgi:hypothetical protein